MKIQLIILLIFTIFSSKIVSSQPVKVSKGDPDINSIVNLNYIGKNNDYIVYNGESSANNGINILITNIKSLDIVQKVEIMQFLNAEKIKRLEIINDHLVVFTFVKKSKKIRSAIKAYLFNINVPLKVDKETVLIEFDEENEANVHYDKVNSRFLISNGIHTKWFSNYLNPLPDIVSHNNDPLPVKNKNIFKINSPKYKSSNDASFFHPIGNKNDLRYYVKSEFVFESSCFMSGGKIQSLEIMAFDTVKKFKKDFFKFEIRQESYLLDYNVSITSDGRFVIIGAYQDKEEKNYKHQFGLFCKILESDMREKAPTYYHEFLSIEKYYENLLDYNYVHSNYTYNLHTVSDISNPYYYYVRNINFKCLIGKFEYLQINKQTAEFSFQSLHNPYSCKSRLNSANAYFPIQIGNKKETIFYIDHISNLGLTSNDSTLHTYVNKYDSVSFAYICFDSDSGFGKRQIVYEAGKEGFLPVMDYKETFISEIDSEGKFELIFPAYDSSGEQIRFYRIEVDSKLFD